MESNVTQIGEIPKPLVLRVYEPENESKNERYGILRDNFYEWLPLLKRSEIAVYNVLARHRDKENYCFMKMSNLARAIGCSNRQTKAAIKGLTNRGLIVSFFTQGQTWHFFIS
jgi:predicted DNA-binding transcriptional regulator